MTDETFHKPLDAPLETPVEPIVEAVTPKKRTRKAKVETVEVKAPEVKPVICHTSTGGRAWYPSDVAADLLEQGLVTRIELTD